MNGEKMKTIAFFNNKGGVGKTTIASTIAYQLTRLGKKVLMMDLDPQSNTTQVVLDEDQVERIFSGKGTARIKTIKDIYDPMRDSNEATIGNVKDSIYKSKTSKTDFQFDLLPSHLKLSEFEDTLSDAWSDLRASKLGGFRRTNWFIQLTDQIEDLYDYVLVDLSPSLGALNRSVLLNIDYFIIPVTGDIYNYYGLSNIGPWIEQWIKIYTRSLTYLSDDYDSVALEEFKINQNISTDNYQKLIGYILSRVKLTRGNKMSYKKDKRIISYQKTEFMRIEKTIFSELEFAINPRLKKDELREIFDSKIYENIMEPCLKLGEIMESTSLLTESQGNNKPLFKRAAMATSINNKQWDKGGAENAEYAFLKTFELITENLINNLKRVKDEK